MTLPPLPRNHSQKEATFGIKLKAFYTKSKPPTASLEIKQTTTDSLPFSAITTAQLDYALAIRSDKGVWLRVYPFVEGMPDYMWLKGVQSWIVIHYAKRGTVWISPDRFILEKKKSKRRSLTWSKAKDIAWRVV